ncbi:hypothetical protein SNEBB_007286 [Seison nebaliae]|nr:hypothetical protein SNEBB_007286 [Seison nebaliae]
MCRPKNLFGIYIFLLLHISATLQNIQMIHSENMDGVTSFNALDVSLADFSLRVHQSFDLIDENIIISPFSIYLILAALCEGARNETYKKLSEKLHVSHQISFQDNMRNRFNSLVSLNMNEKLKIRINSKIMIQKDSFKINENYRFEIKDLLNTDVTYCDFHYNLEKEVKQLNEWVESTTNGMLTDIFTPTMISPATNLFLANIIYFNGDWQYKFEEKLTKERKFFNLNGRIALVDMMRNPSIDIKYDFNYAINSHMVALPYAIDKNKENEESNLFFVIIASENNESYRQLLEVDDSASIALHLLQFVAMAKEIDCDITLPKFEIKFEKSIVELFNKMDLKFLLENNADFSGISIKNGKDLSVDTGFHSAAIRVDEKGSEAAAITSLFIGRSLSLKRKNKIVKIDHPFLYFIYDKSTHTILFEGHISNF